MNISIDNRVIPLRSGSMHVRHGIRWNYFYDEMILKIHHRKKIESVDLIEGISLFLNIYFGLLVRYEKKIDEKKGEKNITYDIKKNIPETLKIRNRFIHIDYEKTKVTNNNRPITEPMNFAFVQNLKSELTWISTNKKSIENNDFTGVKHMVNFLLILIEKSSDICTANLYKIY